MDARLGLNERIHIGVSWRRLRNATDASGERKAARLQRRPRDRVTRWDNPTQLETEAEGRYEVKGVEAATGSFFFYLGEKHAQKKT